MPQRFVEVLDVSYEASVLFSQISNRANEIVHGLGVNISQYINATSNEYDINLIKYLGQNYNISTEDVLHTLSVLNITNSRIMQVPPPSGVAWWLIGGGLIVIVIQNLALNIETKKMLQKYGHAHLQ